MKPHILYGSQKTFDALFSAMNDYAKSHGYIIQTQTMKTINIYFKIQFTSILSDAQPISLGIVSDSLKPCDFPKLYNKNKLYSPCEYKSKSFYSEFSDFDINRCDDLVKENVVSKLKNYPHTLHKYDNDSENVNCVSKTKYIKDWLSDWLSQFSDYNIQFIYDSQSDRGMLSWYWIMQLLAEWEEKLYIQEFCPECGYDGHYPINTNYLIGLPKLPENISSVPQDLNDLIAIKKGITPKKAFEWDREEVAYSFYIGKIWDLQDRENVKMILSFAAEHKHDALWNAKIIKAIYEKLK